MGKQKRYENEEQILTAINRVSELESQDMAEIEIHRSGIKALRGHPEQAHVIEVHKHRGGNPGGSG